MKKILLIATLAISVCANAQIATVVSTQPLLKGVESDMNNPILSPDGTKLLFSSANYANLRMYDFETQEVTQIAPEVRSGFDAMFTPDSREVYFVTQVLNADKMNMRQLKKYNLENNKVTPLTEECRHITQPAVERNAFTTTLNGKKLSKGKIKLAVRTEESKLIVTRNGVDHEYSPVESYVGYLWASLSPDNTKIAFVAAGKGVIITDLEGNVIARLDNKRYEAPVWFGNDHIITQLTTDDGHQLHSSQIVICRADGSASQALTTQESMTMTPATDFSKNKVIYATIDGLLYEMIINLNK